MNLLGDDTVALAVVEPWTALRIRGNRADHLRARLRASDRRFRDAAEQLRTAAYALTPAARMAIHPIGWVIGCFAAGLVLGWLGDPSNRRSRT